MMSHIPTPTPFDKELRRKVSRLLANFFLLHLEAEARKPDEVLHEVFKDLPVRQMLRDLATEVRREFDLGDAPPTAPYNLYVRWCANRNDYSYEDSIFLTYNQVFIYRLLDLRDGTAESSQQLIDQMGEAFGRFDYEKLGFTAAFFLDSESIMRELLREAVRELLPDVALEADALVLAQSRHYQAGMFRYFEGVLRSTLEENVRLLHGILPHRVATELKRNGSVKPVHFEDTAVLFTDFVHFSQSAANLPPPEVIRRLDLYFTEFDRISAAHGLEKIKTIGDSYMAVAGVPEQHNDPVQAACDAALEIAEAARRISESFGPEGWQMRTGIHVGPLMAGVIGKQKFSYDVWGATVNFASRMESSSEPGRINVSAAVQSRVAERYHWEPRGILSIKRLGEAEMFFLTGKK
jgi:class 3 adenylate cyclase